MKFTSILSVVLLFNLALGVSFAVSEVATTEVQVSGNLDIGSPLSDLPSEFITFKVVNDTATFLVPIWVTDSKGRNHQLLLAFLHMASNGWLAIAFVDRTEISSYPSKPWSVGYINFDTPMTGEKTSINFDAILNWTGAKMSNIKFKLMFSAFDNKSIVEKIEIEPHSCSTVETVVDSALDSLEATYDAESSCKAVQESYVVTAVQLANRAIISKNCGSKRFSSARGCRQCYDLAAKPLKQSSDKLLFHGLLGKAIARILAEKERKCATAHLVIQDLK